MTTIPYISFAHADLDTDPFSPGTQFDSKPLDEAEQEDKEVSDVWTISIIIVASFSLHVSNVESTLMFRGLMPEIRKVSG